MPKMVLFGGEKDGMGQDGELTIDGANDCPNVFYAVPLADEERIRMTKGVEAKRKMRDRLAVLAYEFDARASTATTFIMRRRPSLDKTKS